MDGPHNAVSGDQPYSPGSAYQQDSDDPPYQRQNHEVYQTDEGVLPRRVFINNQLDAIIIHPEHHQHHEQQDPNLNPQDQAYRPMPSETMPPGLPGAPRLPRASLLTLSPEQVTCPYCRCAFQTRCENVIGAGTILASAALCLLGCVPCSWIPFCIDDLKDVRHYCSNCDNYLGRVRFIC